MGIEVEIQVVKLNCWFFRVSPYPRIDFIPFNKFQICMKSTSKTSKIKYLANRLQEVSHVCAFSGRLACAPLWPLSKQEKEEKSPNYHQILLQP